MTSRRPRRLAATATLLLLGLGTAACSSSDDASAGAVADSSRVADQSQDAPAAPEAQPAGAQAPPQDDAIRADVTGQRSLIRTGAVSLRAEDVDQVRFDVTFVAESSGGEVAESSTESDRDGSPQRASLTLRVPSEKFDDVLDGLEAVKGAKLISLTSGTEDVSTEVIDTDVRVELQKRSIERISLLLERAQNIQAIVGIERELARREADLGSLQQRQAYLADQTSMSTITVAIQRPAADKDAASKKKDDSGFVAGLEGGWDAFRSVTTGVLTATGALLPFAGLGLVIGVPLWVFLRRRTPRPHPATVDAP